MITVWKDGTYKQWSDADALHAANDPDWLVNIPGQDRPTGQMVIKDERYYKDYVPAEVKQRILLEHIVNERIKSAGLDEMDLSHFTVEFLHRVSLMKDEEFKDWLYG